MSAATRPDEQRAEPTAPSSTEESAKAARKSGIEESYPLLPALTGLTLLTTPFAVAGEVGSLIDLGPGTVEQVLAGCTVGFDLLLVLCGVCLGWRNTLTRNRLWRLGIGPLLAGAAAVGGAALLLVMDPQMAAAAGLETLGRALAGIGTGTLTVFWLRANTGSVRPPSHRPTLPARARTSRTAPLLALAALLVCALRTDVLASVFSLPVYLFSAWLVATLIRAPHSPVTRGLDRLGRWVSPRRPVASASHGPVKRQILLPDPQGASGTIYVARSGRMIDLDQIPAELRLLPLPSKRDQTE